MQFRGVKFTVKVGDVVADLTGWTAKIDLRLSNQNGKLIESWVDASPDILRIDAEGVVRLLIPAGKTNSYKFNIGFMDLLLLHVADGRRSTTLQIELDRGVTR